MPGRLLALLAAVAMVIGAVAVRARLDDGGGAGARPMRLVCSTELAGACERLAGRVGQGLRVVAEPAGTTAARLSAVAGGDAGLDGWLVPAPWPEMVEDARGRGGLEPVLRPGPVLARSPMVLAVWPDRAEVLRRRCPGGAIGWRCLGDVAGAQWSDIGGRPTWGPVKPGHDDPSQEAAGLAALAAATTAFFGRTDVGLVDLDENDDYRAWVTRLERAVPTFRPSGGTPMADMLLKGPAAFDAVGATEAEAGPLVATSARPDKPGLLYPAPVVTVDAVLATVPGQPARRLAERVQGEAGRASLAEGGWRVPGRRSAAGVPATPALPGASGLPPAGVLDALRRVGREVTG